MKCVKLFLFTVVALALLSCHEQGDKKRMEMIIEDSAELSTITDVVKVRDTQHNNDDICSCLLLGLKKSYQRRNLSIGLLF